MIRRDLLLGAASLLGCGSPARPISLRERGAPRPPGPVAAAPALVAATEPRATEAWALFEAFPSLERSVPRIPLIDAPTPVERAGALEERLGIAAVTLKRDDKASALYGGGKARKLEVLLGEARARGRTRLVTMGSVGSHHALATALHGRAQGFEVDVLLMPEPRSPHVKETLARTLASGARARLVGTLPAAQRAALALARDGAWVVPVGGTSPAANVAFVSAGFELARAVERGELEEPERVFLPLGTTGSAVGLAVGLAAAGLDRCEVIAVRASSVATSSDRAVARGVEETVAWLRAREASFPVVTPRLRIDGAELGRGYALPTRAGEVARDLAASAAGLTLESTYTAKSFASLSRAARTTGLARALFWMTHDARPPSDAELALPAGIPRDLAGWLT